jgi:hypothetical protein
MMVTKIVGITNANYMNAGNFYVMKNPDTFLNVGAIKTTNSAGGTISLQVCYEDNFTAALNWFQVGSGTTATINLLQNTPQSLTGANTFFTGIKAFRIFPSATAGMSHDLVCCEFIPPQKYM